MLKVGWDHVSMQGMINSLPFVSNTRQSALEQVSKARPVITVSFFTLNHTLWETQIANTVHPGQPYRGYKGLRLVNGNGNLTFNLIFSYVFSVVIVTGVC